MRLNYKYIIIVGLALAAAEVWFKLARPQDPDAPAPLAADPPTKVFARESSSAAKLIPSIPVTNWGVQLGAVLTSTGSTTNQAINLLAMFPNLPAEAQVDAAQHASRLLPDDYFGALGSHLTNSAAAPAVRRVIFADLVTRRNHIRLPWLVEIARAGMDEQADEAAVLLKSQLREDHGANWPLWRERVAVWLSLHPDQPPPAIPGTTVSN